MYAFSSLSVAIPWGVDNFEFQCILIAQSLRINNSESKDFQTTCEIKLYNFKCYIMFSKFDHFQLKTSKIELFKIAEFKI